MNKVYATRWIPPPFRGLGPSQKRGPCHFRPWAPQNSFCFGNPAVPEGPVAFRPTIARGLALSRFFFLSVLGQDNSKCRAIHMMTRYSVPMSCCIKKLEIGSQFAKESSRDWAAMPIRHEHTRKAHLLNQLKDWCRLGRVQSSISGLEFFPGICLDAPGIPEIVPSETVEKPYPTLFGTHKLLILLGVNFLRSQHLTFFDSLSCFRYSTTLRVFKFSAKDPLGRFDHLRIKLFPCILYDFI